MYFCFKIVCFAEENWQRLLKKYFSPKDFIRVPMSIRKQFPYMNICVVGWMEGPLESLHSYLFIQSWFTNGGKKPWCSKEEFNCICHLLSHHSQVWKSDKPCKVEILQKQSELLCIYITTLLLITIQMRNTRHLEGKAHTFSSQEQGQQIKNFVFMKMAALCHSRGTIQASFYIRPHSDSGLNFPLFFLLFQIWNRG
jgi:hypothetical protein